MSILRLTKLQQVFLPLRTAENLKQKIKEIGIVIGSRNFNLFISLLITIQLQIIF